MTVLNKMDRYNLVIDAIDRLPKLGEKGQKLKEMFEEKLKGHKLFINKHGVDMPEIANWKWK